jgi:hypothetical protein
MPRDDSHNPVAGAAARVGMLAAAVLFALPAWALHWPTLHWPWHHGAPSPPQPVQVLAIDAAGQTIQQYWDRNTLLLDLTRVQADGSAQLTPLAGSGWPVRLEFRVRPGSIGRLEVRAAQRTIFTVPAQGASAVLKLDPGVYQPDSAQISLRWSAAGDSAH